MSNTPTDPLEAELDIELRKLFKSYAVGVSAGMGATMPKTVYDAEEHLKAVISMAKALIHTREQQARVDELQKALSKAIEFYEYSVAPHRFAEPINQSLEKRVDQDAVPTKEIIDRLATLNKELNK